MNIILRTVLIILALSSVSIRAENLSGDSHFTAISPPSCSQMMTDSLFEHKAWYATLKPNTKVKGEYELKLLGLKPSVVYFSQQPFQMGRMQTKQFCALWQQKSDLKFKASIEGLNLKSHPKATSVSYRLRLSEPHYQNKSVTYKVTLLGKAKLDQALRLRDVTLLITVPACAQCDHYPCLSC